MSSLGKVRIGSPAPNFHCDAVVRGKIEEVTLSTYISPSRPQWLIMLFIPAAFSSVCPTEVLAFQNCLDEFRDRNCNVIFVSVDTKHSLWHWQNVPRQYGGLGQIDIDLLSDANHRMSRDFGVLIEEEGVSLRGMFILDDQAIVQQITLNNLTVGRSVLEALRLLEAFQAVAKHGILCPIETDWRPSANAQETLNTISDTLAESYEDRLANLQKEFGDTPITDLDAKHSQDDSSGTPSGTQITLANSRESTAGSTSEKSMGSTSSKEDGKYSSSTTNTTISSRANSNAEKVTTPSKPPSARREGSSASASIIISSADSLPRRSPDFSLPQLLKRHESTSAPVSAGVTPTPTPSSQIPPSLSNRKGPLGGTARHSRGHSTSIPPPLLKHNTYESRRGSHVILEFADPTLSSPQGSPSTTPLPISPNAASRTSSPGLSRTTSITQYPPSRIATPRPSMPKAESPSAGSQTRLQMTFEAIKKMSSGLASPRIDFGTRRSTSEEKTKNEAAKSEASNEPWGYFDVVREGVEA